MSTVAVEGVENGSVASYWAGFEAGLMGNVVT